MNEAEINEYAARQMRMLRAARGISQTKLAKKVGMSPQQVQKYEWGINRLSVGKLMLFAEAFGVPATVFLPGADDYLTEAIHPPNIKFFRLLNEIMPRHWDDIYEALKAMARIAQKARL